MTDMTRRGQIKPEPPREHQVLGTHNPFDQAKERLRLLQATGELNQRTALDMTLGSAIGTSIRRRGPKKGRNTSGSFI